MRTHLYVWHNTCACAHACKMQRPWRTRLICCKHRHLFQTLADNEDRHNQLTDTLETHKYHFEQAVKVANFPEVSRLKELMQRTQFDIGERYS